jgi:spermidine/putrescine transport system permease protein
MKLLRFLFLLPTRLLIGVLFLAPMVVIVAYSFMTRGTYGGQAPPWTIENFTRLADPLYLAILGNSFWLAGISTLICMILGFPLAWFITRSGARKSLYLNLVMLPFWTSFLVRTYAWMFLLRDTGLVNNALMGLHLTAEPLPLLYNDAAVVLGLVYGYLPFMVLPIYATLERLDSHLLEAAADLGSSPAVAFARVVLPLSVPGMIAGAILVFVPSLGAYLTPDLLGGGKSIMIGNLVQNQFTSARDWPFGSASSLALMAIIMVLLAAGARRAGKELL